MIKMKVRVTSHSLLLFPELFPAQASHFLGLSAAAQSATFPSDLNSQSLHQQLEILFLETYLHLLSSALSLSFSARISDDNKLTNTVNVLKFRTQYLKLFWPRFCYFMQLFHKILSGRAHGVAPDQTAPFAYAILSETLVFEILGYS